MFRFFIKFLEVRATKNYDKVLIEKLNRITGDPIFWNDYAKVYGKFNELNGHKYLSLRITGFLKINTIEGCVLTFVGEAKDYEIKSESEIVKGDYSAVSRIGLTKFDVDIDSKWIDFLESNEIFTIQLKTRNGQITKTKLEFEFREFDLEKLIGMLKG